LIAFHLAKFTEKKLFDVPIEIDGITEVLCGESAFSGQSLGRKKVLHPVSGHSFHLKIPFVDQPLQKSIHEPYREVEALGKLSLAGIAIPVELTH